MKDIKLLTLLFLFTLLFSACSGNLGTELPQTQEPSPTAIVLPTDTPTPLSPVGVLLTPDGSDPGLAEELNSIIGSYMREEGLRYQVLNTLVEDDFDREDYQIVVVLFPYPDLAVLAEDHPDTKFLAVGFNDLEPRTNLSVLQSGGGAFDVQGFIAGYIAAMITTDWRVGALGLQDNDDALAAREGFQVGVKYYCGLCNPKYAPTGINYIYPKFIDLPVDAAEEQVNANLDFLVDRAVNTFYIAPGVGTQNIYRTLVGYQKWIIGSGSDYQEEYKDYWVVSLDYDLLTSLDEVWPRFISADTGIVESPPLLLTDINDALLSEGKVNLVYKILEDVKSGYIKTSFVE